MVDLWIEGEWIRTSGRLCCWEEMIFREEAGGGVGLTGREAAGEGL